MSRTESPCGCWVGHAPNCARGVHLGHEDSRDGLLIEASHALLLHSALALRGGDIVSEIMEDAQDVFLIVAALAGTENADTARAVSDLASRTARRLEVAGELLMRGEQALRQHVSEGKGGR